MLHRQGHNYDINACGESQRYIYRSVIQIRVIMIGYLTLRADYVNTVFEILISAWLGID